MLRTSLVAASLALCLLPRTTKAADPPAANSQPPSEQLFLLYILEDFYRDTWPDENSVGDVQQIEAFVARHKTLADSLRRHIEKARLGDELANLYFSYGKSLDTLMAKAAKVVTDHKKVQEDLLWSKKRRLLEKWTQDVGASQFEAIAESGGVTRRASRHAEGTRSPLFSTATQRRRSKVLGSSSESRQPQMKRTTNGTTTKTTLKTNTWV